MESPVKRFPFQRPERRFVIAGFAAVGVAFALNIAGIILIRCGAYGTHPIYWNEVVSWAANGAYAIGLLLFLMGMRGREKRLKRLTEGHCTSCGYDVRSSPERCPECGTAVNRKP
jgi:hypothetical protein